ncbi:hypothetical protein ABEB36_015586 [Hypothenemus hampei]|uniref:MADF domain-containing protein n=1 Tax=Hypothenemus hampei TaxID=57062 RepID=A0ABD1E3Y7_HYPHA
MEQESSLEEFLIFCKPPQLYNTSINKENVESTLKQPNVISQEKDCAVNWTSNHTKVLLDVYKKYRPKLWEVMAIEINDILKTNYNSGHVENRWRVVERSYKKFVDNQNKTGRGRKYFEYQEEMDNIFKGKKNIKPDVLLSTDTVDHLVEETEPSQSSSSVAQTPRKTLPLKRKHPLNRNLVIEQTRKDRKEYNRKRIEVEMRS